MAENTKDHGKMVNSMEGEFISVPTVNKEKVNGTKVRELDGLIEKV